MNQLIQTKMGKRKRTFFSCVCGLSDHISVLPSKFQVNPSLLRFQVVLKNLILLLYCIKNVMPCPLLLTAFFYFRVSKVFVPSEPFQFARETARLKYLFH